MKIQKVLAQQKIPFQTKEVHVFLKIQTAILYPKPLVLFISSFPSFFRK